MIVQKKGTLWNNGNTYPKSSEIPSDFAKFPGTQNPPNQASPRIQALKVKFHVLRRVPWQHFADTSGGKYLIMLVYYGLLLLNIKINMSI